MSQLDLGRDGLSITKDVEPMTALNEIPTKSWLSQTTYASHRDLMRWLLAMGVAGEQFAFVSPRLRPLESVVHFFGGRWRARRTNSYVRKRQPGPVCD